MFLMHSSGALKILELLWVRYNSTSYKLNVVMLSQFKKQIDLSRMIVNNINHFKVNW